MKRNNIKYGGRVILFCIQQISISLLILSLNANMLFATGVVDSGHNMLKQDEAMAKLEKGGVCSFCHRPHSSGGNMAVEPPVNSDAEVQVKKIGATGTVCSQSFCHGASGVGPKMVLNIFYNGAFTTNHPLLYDTTDPYGTTGTKQWMSNWPGTSEKHTVEFQTKQYMTIECTSCHNVHSVTANADFESRSNAVPHGTGQSGEFLRAKPFDTTSEIGNTQFYDPAVAGTSKQIFCEYCHAGRSTMGWGPYNSTSVRMFSKGSGDYSAPTAVSTHPVGRPKYGVTADGMKQRAIKDNSLGGVRGWNGSILIDKAFIASRRRVDLITSVAYGGHMGGSEDPGMGYETSDVTRGVVICQSCHVPHSANPGGQIDAYGDDIYDAYTSEMASTRQDLLAMNNRVDDSTDLAAGGTDKGFNALCERCHSYRPFLRVQAINLVTGDAGTVVGHPLRHHKADASSGGASTNGNYNHNDSWDSADFVNKKSCFDDATLGKRSIIIPTSWPSGKGLGINDNGYAVVCLTCHDVHGGKPNTALLRAIPLCVECHKGPLASLGISHPVDVPLTNEDGGVWEDQASLTLFTSQTWNGTTVTTSSSKIYNNLSYTAASSYSDLKTVKANTMVKISCETCHDWTNGNIHYNVRRIRNVRLETDRTAQGAVKRYTKGESNNKPGVLVAINADANAESQLCVSCHTNDDYSLLATDIPNGNIRYGDASTDGGIGANISPYTREYPLEYTGKNLMPGVATGLDMEPSGVTGITDLASRNGTHATQIFIADNEEGESGNSHPNRQSWIVEGAWGDRGDFIGGSYNSSCIKFSGKKSKWGSLFTWNAGDTSLAMNAIIVCQSCHTPHKAAAGLVEYNTGGVEKEQSPHSALLLATQAESYMCRACHLRGGNVAHPVSLPSAGLGAERDTTTTLYPAILTWYRNSNLVGGPNKMRRSDAEHKLLLTIDAEEARVGVTKKDAIYLRSASDVDAGGWTWGVTAAQGPAKPANYPKAKGSLDNFKTLIDRGYPGQAVDANSRLVCDSCHAPHSAGTAMGTYCLEGNDSSIPGNSVKGGSNVTHVGGTHDAGGGAAQPGMGNDNPTCILCHVQ